MHCSSKQLVQCKVTQKSVWLIFGMVRYNLHMSYRLPGMKGPNIGVTAYMKCTI